MKLVEKIIFRDHLPLRIRMPEDSYALVEEMKEDDFREDERMPYWADLWPSSIALARFVREEMQVKDQSILELGCGLGLVSLAAAQCEADITATDYFPEAIEFAKENAGLNLLDMKCSLLDWRKVPEGKKYALVLGADILYEKRNHAPVLQAIAKLLQPGGNAVLTDPLRAVSDSFAEFAESNGFSVRIFHRKLESEDFEFIPEGTRISEIRFFELRIK